MENTSINSINGGENTPINDNQTQQAPSEGIDELLAENLVLRETNHISAQNEDHNLVLDSVIDPFAGDINGQLNELIFGRLKSLLGENFFDGPENSPVGGGSNLFAGDDSLTVNQDNVPVGNGNQNFGSDNATIGNSNSDFGSDSATIGNGNWNYDNNNATIGNGNWLFASDNTTLGNGNWYWDDGSNNTTLGNGNWQFNSDNATIGNGNWGFGNNNTTIGNGNWDFGNNNTVVGNGNWIFDDNNTVVGNGNWIFDDHNTIVGNEKLDANAELIPPDFQNDVDHLIDSLIGSMGEHFLPLTASFGESETETLNRLILSQDNGNLDIDTDIEQFLALLNGIQSYGTIPHQSGPNSQPVPDSTSSISLILVGLTYVLFSKLQQGFCRRAK